METKIHENKFFLFFVVLSFFYELPIIHIGPDRINPRLFDLLFLYSLFKYPKQMFKLSLNNDVLRYWFYIICVFSLCAIFWLFFTPFQYSLYSILFVLRYWQGFLVVNLVCNLGINTRTVGIASFYGLLFIAIYCIYEYHNPHGAQYEIYPGKFVAVPKGALFGPLSPTYFHLAQFLPLATLVVLSYGLSVRNKLIVVFSLLSAWPILFSGSRTGLALLVISLSCFLVLLKSRYKLFYILLILVISMVVCQSDELMNFMQENSLTFKRTADLESANHSNSISGRLKILEQFIGNKYDAHWIIVILLGAGVNMASIGGSYRIGYGIHSMYLYPYEQGGLLLFILFILFLLTLFRKIAFDNFFGIGVLSYVIAMCIVGLGGHNFWREFGSGNFNTYCVMLFALVVNKQLINKQK